MAATVSEIMNREVFSVHPEESAYAALGFILSLGITAAPVVDASGRVLGIVSIRDLVPAPTGGVVAERMSKPPLVLQPEMLIRDAAHRLIDCGVHHMPVIDAADCVIGFVGSVDLLRAVLGEPVHHPDTFPHHDSRTGLAWSNNHKLSRDALVHAPDGPGRLELICGREGEPETVLWLESASNVRTRLEHILDGARNVPSSVRISIDEGALRYRATPLLPDDNVVAAQLFQAD